MRATQEFKKLYHFELLNNSSVSPSQLALLKKDNPLEVRAHTFSLANPW
jgi:hypothetical protein